MAYERYSHLVAKLKNPQGKKDILDVLQYQ